MQNTIDTPDWSAIPAPDDDGAAQHLPGMALPVLSLPATDGTTIDLSALPGRTIVYAYPRTGQAGAPNPGNWDMIPGARGCSPQSCSFRDHFTELERLGARHLFGLSTQDTAYQAEAAARLRLPFPLLSDAGLRLAQAMHLPMMDVSDLTLLRRLTLVIDNGRVTHVFYPVFPPDRNAQDVLDWLAQHPAPSGR